MQISLSGKMNYLQEKIQNRKRILAQAGHLYSSEFKSSSKISLTENQNFSLNFLFTIHPDLVGRMIAQAQSTDANAFVSTFY